MCQHLSQLLAEYVVILNKNSSHNAEKYSVILIHITKIFTIDIYIFMSLDFPNSIMNFTNLQKIPMSQSENILNGNRADTGLLYLSCIISVSQTPWLLRTV